MRVVSQNFSIIFFNSQLVLLFLMLIVSGCTHFKPENDPTLLIQKIVKRSFFSNGTLEYEAEFLNGKLDGISKVWLEDGTLYSVSQYSNDQPHGNWKKFHPNGKLMFEVNYEYGQKHGTEKWYYENGNIKSEQEFEFGNTKSAIIRWKFDGTLLY